ncbi:MAG: NAD-dependent succinate-semialdehyde dehydrogenase [Planctomycetota bacterium]|jgi:succinate-semialdehyde dehydrogenase/glutarate-semialdehyde dehydrogenase
MKTYQVYLNGNWVGGTDTLTVVNPANGEAFARVVTVDAARVKQAIEDAQAAFVSWRNLTARTRGDYLLAVASEMHKRTDQIARTITLENGKPLAQSRGEVAVAVDHFRWFAEQGRRAYGRVVPHQADGKRHLVIKSPIGVVGAISPWNFPLMLAIRKVAPALAVGCPVLLKPASATPLCAIALAECVEAAGLPAGVFQLVVGNAQQIGGEMLGNPLCRKISFTGSTEVGKTLIRQAAHTVTKLSLELGGHAPVLVFDDADLDQAVEGTMMAKYRNIGQSCIAANRVYVQRSIFEPFVERFVARSKALKIGDGLDQGVEIGPLINKQGLDDALNHIQNALDGGAKVLCGGKRWGDKGNFLEPTILVDVPEDALCMRDETFAPVTPVCVFDSDQEAIERANATEYGLAAYAFTSNVNRAWRLAEALEAGTIGINDGVTSTSQCPFGGLKQSGWGRELGDEGLDAYLETKHISFAGVTG